MTLLLQILDPVLLEDQNQTAEPSENDVKATSAFSKVSDMFHSIEVSLLDDLDKRGVMVNEVRNRIATLPLLPNKESYASIKPFADELEDYKTLTGLFNFLNAFVWTYVDYHLLEYVVAEFGSEHLKERVKQYVANGFGEV